MRRSLALTLGAVAAVPLTFALAGPAAAVAGPTGYDGVASGPRASTTDGTTRPAYFQYDPTLGFSLSDLAAGESVTFTTTIAANPNATNWNDPSISPANLYAVGFLRVVPSETVVQGTPLASPAHDQDPVIWGQDNQGAGSGVGGMAFCSNDKFFVGGAFVFGPGEHCVLPNDSADGTAMDQISTERYTVTIEADGTWTGTVVPLDAAGDVVTSFVSADVPPSYTGTLPGDASTEFVPFVRARAGAYSDSTGLADPDGDWKIEITDSSLVTPFAAPAATPSATPSVSAPAAAAPSPSASAQAGAELAATGSQNVPTAALAGALLVAGIGGVLLARRRRA
ncbi:LPXTG cell wall anchor domain-containing protein [Cellulomonas sp. P5_C6]